MTGRMIFNQVNSLGDLDLSEATAISLIDIAQRKASLELPVVRSTNIPIVTPGQVVPFPDGVFKLLSATSTLGEYPLSSITVNSSSLVFLDGAAGVNVQYTGMPPSYTNLDHELSIHPALHTPLAYFILSIYYDMEGEGDSEESNIAERMYQRWVYYRNMAISTINGTDYDTHSKEPIPTLDTLPKASRRPRGSQYE